MTDQIRRTVLMGAAAAAAMGSAVAQVSSDQAPKVLDGKPMPVRNRTNVWNYPGFNGFARKGSKDSSALHPTVKPVALVSDAILDSTNRNDIVLDPYLGSGTTILAAARTGRRCFGVEIDPIYVDTAVVRWQRMSGLEAQNAQGHLRR
jgi:DNA modification methylase